MIAEMAHFFGWSFEDCWNMPASRFFALMRGMRKAKLLEKMDNISLFSIPLTDHKYVTQLRDRLNMEWDSITGFDPEAEAASLRRKDQSPEEQKKTAAAVMQVFALKRRLDGR